MIHQVMFKPDGTVFLPVHFVTGVDEDGLEVVACMEGMKHLAAYQCRSYPYQRTNDTRAVSCILCKETKVYTDAAAKASSSISRTKPSPDDKVTIHFAPNSLGGEPACGTQGRTQRTDDVRACNCPACLKTADAEDAWVRLSRMGRPVR